MTNKAEENPRSSVQPLIPNLKNSVAGRSEQQPVRNLYQSVLPNPVINHQLAIVQANDQMIGCGSVINVVGQSVLKTHSAISERRAGKHPMNNNTASILGLSSAHLFEESLGFSSSQLLTTQITPVPPSGNARFLGMMFLEKGLFKSSQLVLQDRVRHILQQHLMQQMAFGREWDNERKLAFKNDGDAEKMLELYIYNYIKKKNLHDVADFFAKEANIETPQLMEIEENLLTEWWHVFWPIFCSSPSQNVKVNIVTDEKYIFLGNEKDADEMLHLYIYHYMKKRELHEATKMFSKEANIEMSEFLDYDGSLLKDWWEVFWHRCFFRMTKQPGGNPQSSAQPSTGESLEMLDSLKRSQQLPIENPPQHVSNVVGQPPEGMSEAPQGMSQRGAGKHPMNTDSSSILGHLTSKEKGKGPLGFPPVKLLPTEVTRVLHSGNFSHLEMRGSIQPPPQVVGAYESIQLEPTYPPELDFAYSPTTLIAGENYRKNPRLLSGGRVNE